MDKLKENSRKILFVCLGNICRSPSAEAVMKSVVDKAGLNDNIYIDSAGIIGNHRGKGADSRMITHALKRGYDLTSISRQVCKADFENFDIIVAMDNQNVKDLKSLTVKKEELLKICKMTDFCTKYKIDVVPDPYYGGEDGFELVLDILEDGCQGLLKASLKVNSRNSIS